MIRCYAIKQNDGNWFAPVNIIRKYNNVNEFHKLTDKQREQHG